MGDQPDLLHRTLNVNGYAFDAILKGPESGECVLLLHGFPTSSFQYRELMPRIADKYRVIAPDLPGFGFTEVPEKRRYQYTFEALARTIEAFTDALQLFAVKTKLRRPQHC